MSIDWLGVWASGVLDGADQALRTRALLRSVPSQAIVPERMDDMAPDGLTIDGPIPDDMISDALKTDDTTPVGWWR
nr:F44 [uncultured bacterium]